MPPYSRVTALHTCVYACWFGPDAHCKFLISALKYFTRIVCYCLTADAMSPTAMCSGSLSTMHEQQARLLIRVYSYYSWDFPASSWFEWSLAHGHLAAHLAILTLESTTVGLLAMKFAIISYSLWLAYSILDNVQIIKCCVATMITCPWILLFIPEISICCDP